MPGKSYSTTGSTAKTDGAEKTRRTEFSVETLAAFSATSDVKINSHRASPSISDRGRAIGQHHGVFSPMGK